MNQQDKAKAAGAVSIDTQEFRELFIAAHDAEVRLSAVAGTANQYQVFDEASTAKQALVAHIDAHAAQRYDAGKADQTAFLKKCLNSDLDEFNRKWTEQKDRAEAVEASLARLVEGVGKIVRWDRSDEGMSSGPDPNDGRFIEFADLAALLPAKAEAPTSGPTPDIVSASPDVATPSPAMGDELRCSPKSAENEQQAGLMLMGKELPPQDERAAFEEAVCKLVPRPLFLKDSRTGDYQEIMVRGFWSVWEVSRTYIALRQPGAWAWERRVGAAEAFLQNYADTNMEKLLGDYEVQPIIRRLAAAILEWQQDANCSLAAPVSQPAAQEQPVNFLEIARAAGFGVDGNEVFANNKEGICTDELLAFVLIATAPQPITAPAGSEQIAKAMALYSGWEHWDSATGCTHTLSGNDPEDEREYWRGLAVVALAAQQKNEAQPEPTDPAPCEICDGTRVTFGKSCACAGAEAGGHP